MLIAPTKIRLLIEVVVQRRAHAKQLHAVGRNVLRRMESLIIYIPYEFERTITLH